MTHFNTNDFENLHHLYRINLINSCSGYKSANLIGTKSLSGVSNVAIFSSVTHIGSNPPLLGFFLRPTTVIRNTYENIKETGYFTINHVDFSFIEDAHHTSAKYDKDVSEFEMTNLEETYKNDFIAPFVNQSPIQMAMKYVEEYDIKANDTILVIGEIQELYIKDGLLQNDGFIDLSLGNVASINGLDGYTIPKNGIRQSYQRPKTLTEGQ
uniref:flavin reductase family protein n=2 Tax=Gelidibacter sp. TaxID=2018083 RepID=UPI004048FE2D